MIKTQIQLPDRLYKEAKRVAQEREMSLAEVVRRGVEYITSVYPPLKPSAREWRPPRPQQLGSFLSSADEWRLQANTSSEIDEI